MSEHGGTQICPACGGSGKLDGGSCSPPYDCDRCGGTGRIDTGE